MADAVKQNYGSDVIVDAGAQDGIEGMRKTVDDMVSDSCSTSGLAQVADFVALQSLPLETVGSNFFNRVDPPSQDALKTQLQAAGLTKEGRDLTHKGAKAIGQCLVNKGVNQKTSNTDYSESDLCQQVVQLDSSQSTYGGSLGCELEWARMQNTYGAETALQALHQTRKGGAAMKPAFKGNPE